MFDLTIVTSPEDWQTYHDIRYKELFLAFGDRDYNRNHPDDYQNEDNIPFLLKHEGKGVAVARFDNLNNGEAIIRLVAVKKEMQRQGVGAELHNRISEYARSNGVKKNLVNAAPTATKYYKAMGFENEIWDENELQGIASECVQMSVFIK
jgi:N-acetylglutamate synthase-like GNAT family acetyltransferase